jgi:phage terminase large subunit
VPEIDIDYAAPPTIWRFMESDAPVRALIGPFGSGKSSACVVELFRRAVQQARGPDGLRRTRFTVVRNTYPELRDTTRKTFEEWIPAELGVWRERDFAFDIEFNDVRSEILFRALDRPDDIKKLMSLELTGAWINEAREVPRAVFEVLEGRVGRYPSVARGGCTWSGVFCDSNPWARNHWGYMLFSQGKVIGSDGKAIMIPESARAKYALFEQPGGRSPEAENVEHLPAGYYDRLAIGKDSDWITSYVDGGYPEASEGSIWGAAIAELEERGGLAEFTHETDGVFTVWDLGISDSTAIWFFRYGPGRVPHVVDYYEEHGQALSHYFDVLDSRGYRYEKHFIPHDARARTLVTGSTVEEQLVEHWGRRAVAIVPGLSLLDGVQAGRWLLEQEGLRIHPRCEAGIEALRAYHYRWDDDAKVYSRQPEHDWSSHAADAWRYLAIVVRPVERLTRPKPTVDPHDGSALRLRARSTRPIEVMRPTLDDLFRDQERQRRRI